MDKMKVIKGLECCSGFNCSGCQYDNKRNICNDCIGWLCADALTLLKEHEAKCLTKEELSGLQEQQFVWIEGKSGSLYCLRIIGIIEWENDVTAIQFDTPTAYVEKSTELYGSQYKIWTAQPTAEQRETVEWNA